MFDDILRKYSIEEVATSYARSLERRDPGAENLFKWVLDSCGGIMNRYDGTLPKKTLQDVLRGACIAYADGPRKLSLADTYILMIDDKIAQEGRKAPKKRNMDVMEALAFTGNSFGGFRRRGDTSRPEELAVSKYGSLTRKRQTISQDPEEGHEETDEEISDFIDSLLFG